MYFPDDEENESGNEDEGAATEGDGGNAANAEDSDKKTEKVEKDSKPENDIKPNSSTNKAILENPNIDNPYLRAATLPKRAKPDPVLLVAATAAANISTTSQNHS